MAIPRFIDNPFGEEDEFSSIRCKPDARQSLLINNMPVG